MVKKRLLHALVFLSLLLILCAFLFPVYWMFATSLKGKAEIFAYPPSLVPQSASLQNYGAVILGASNDSVVLGEGGYFKYLRNSLIAAGSACLICIVAGSFGAYGLVRLRMSQKRKRDLSFWIISTRMMPPIAAAIPFYLMFRQLRLLDNLLSLIISYIAMNLPFVIWTLQGFFREVPPELHEAAKLDGCGPFSSFLRVVFPLSLPGLFTAMIFTFIFSWNEFLFALILTGENTKTMPVAAASMWSAVASRWGEIATVGITTILPVFLLSLCVQKYFIKGMTFGAIK
ncbi:MAG: carbohydrate ABC transporter permease [Clostridiales bacterium]|nr:MULTISPECIES: carbohydrate ABC transporter permease [Oscillospiraceae]PWM35824.1 MAG: carbohydrate ABC transporter permease [Clostridiales bacterium]RGB64133.1 carbohydrate ABC transporter permease [Harryflintia acetispora]